MAEIQDTIHVMVEYFTGQEEGADDLGHPYYVASCQEIVAVTQGDTWSELIQNIHEMIRVHLEGEDTVSLYDLLPNPQVVIRF